MQESASAPTSAGLKAGTESRRSARPAARVSDITAARIKHTPLGLPEFDRVIGGGMVPGEVLVISGEPGVGKSTLLLAVANQFAAAGNTVLYISGEESREQVGLRAVRVGADSENLLLADETDLALVLGHIEDAQPDLVIIDSLQAIASTSVDGRVGGVSQVMEVATVLTRTAKAGGFFLIATSQVTKQLEMSGPQALAHAVDVLCDLRGDPNSSLRILRVGKNRFGSSDEVACYEQTDEGIVEVADPSGLFLAQREDPVPGTCVTIIMEGRRALPAEIQSLVTATNSPNPRRGVSGLDAARVAMVTAVTDKRARLRLFEKDTFVATVGGMLTKEPAADLAIALALTSAATDVPLPPDVVAIGEVTLSGDIRRCSGTTRRLEEAARLGYRRALVPVGTEKPKGSTLTLIHCDNLTKAVSALHGFS